MSSTVIGLPAGQQLEHQLDEIEAQDHDAAVRVVIEKRIKAADVANGAMQSHNDVFAAYKARLMARLSGAVDA